MPDSLFMFISVQSWTLDGSWCCLWTDADRKTRSSRGPSKTSLTWPLSHRCRTKAGSSGRGRTAVAAWVASVREGFERRTRDCLNMEEEKGQAEPPEARSQLSAYRSQSKSNVLDFRRWITHKLQNENKGVYAKAKTAGWEKENSAYDEDCWRANPFCGKHVRETRIRTS